MEPRWPLPHRGRPRMARRCMPCAHDCTASLPAGSRAPEVADDLTQEVLLRLLTHDDGRVRDPTAWLYRVARNVIIDHYRTRGSSSHWLDAGDLAPAGPAEEPFADGPQAAQRELARCLGPL